MEERVEIYAKESSREVLEVMDTPERSKNSQIAASISKFEDSPVFTFLNSLSPIKPVKSTHITQTINPLSFASIPSVFTSPHVSSVRESRFLRRHQLSDPSKPEFSSDDGAKLDTNKANADASKQLDDQKESGDGDVAAEPSYDCSKFVVDFAKDYECASPNSNLRPGCGLEGKGMADYGCSSSALVQLTREPPQRGEVNIDGVNQNREAAGSCDWEHMISDTSELLVFESPVDRDSYSKSVDPGTSFYTGIKSDMQNLHLICAVDSGEHVAVGNEAETLSTQPGEGDEMDNTIIAGPSMSNSDEKMDYEQLGFYRGMRRRCLVFEMGGARRKHLEENPVSDSSVWLCSDGNTTSNDQKLASVNRGNESSRCLLPGIGLHLNALATTPKDYKVVNPDSSSSARLLIGPSSVVNLHPSHPSSVGQGLLDNILPAATSDRDVDSMENAVLPAEDACPLSAYAANEEINQGSPKKKRRRTEQAGEGESCKRCNCKRSKCLKLYCECFAAGVYCVEPCACIDCFNKPIYEDTVLATRKQIESRNPLAFAPKVIRGSDSPSEIGDDSSKTPASARHKRGCNCKKSGCLKKYCECYQGGVGCSVNCRCEGCKNAFGRKDGTEAEAEEEDETEASEKSSSDKCLQKSAMESDVEHNTDTAPLATPLRGGRSSAQLPFSSKKKPPRSSFPSIASSSSSFLPRQGFGKSSFFPPPPKFETIREDEIPDFLQGGGSPDGGVQSSSPNRKRVSPPHNAGSTSPGLRSSRKLILESIPSFPSLTPNQ
ncbi:protein tesmin/TSO1-like CXC 2 isoform X2 [Salvia miltiorrhiza]|uniref:protein tesmin/TSO1-like CXC 2 isoform X2 n=1 Tax=Salvia miltiorrhiza TaxID=226208 RepID=UPI0025AD3816|nr:protein tesmin/TSO1-like CXC 2 isoform X2 [Salvia miltiorrhiza]XP_057771626.1 protein tesmin/TSO1-like CXC 2 isoform X2 [Salvia miltiorrhiza]XP_057771627.1 protein tesmin/TSO1-like CXC 2 isoform X2 [Salvia miltiorrhiza]